ncbi:MAG: aminopeptidase P family protein [Nitrospirae bacterium]|nr:aminopeptidase P family protein [Nitrospirota bacterium]
MNRLQALIDALNSRGVDGILVSDIRNIRYLSDFRGTHACLLISSRERLLFTDSRYIEQAGKETRGFEIVLAKEDLSRSVLKRAAAAGIRVLGFESSVTYVFYRSLLRKGVRLKAVSNLVEDMRKVKDRAELELIQKAIVRAEKAFTGVKPYIRQGASERRIAGLLEEGLKKSGCRVLPFDIIVASGPNSSMPHADPTDNRIKAGDLVVIDWGGEAGGYFSDMTRTFLINGKGIEKKKEMYETVLSANIRALESVREGIPVGMVDKAARDVIKKAGYDDFFGHGTGHGVGLEIHELPRVSRVGRESIRPGMVFTIEPGIYIPGVGGVRIEDMIVAGRTGCTILTSIPKTLEILH